MFSLVLWITAEPVTSSVVSDDKIKVKKSKTLAQWGKDWYEAKVVLTSSDIDYLNSVVVDVDGNIMTPERRLSFPDAVISKKRVIAADKRKLTAIKSSASTKSDTELLKMASIFSDQSSDSSDENINTASEEKKKRMEKDQNDRTGKKQDSSAGNKQDARDKKQDVGGKQKKKTISKKAEIKRNQKSERFRKEVGCVKSSHNARDEPAVNTEDQASIKEREDVSDDISESVIVEDKQNAQDDNANTKETDKRNETRNEGQEKTHKSAADREPAIRDFLVSNQPGTGKVRLLKGFSIYIDQAELNFLKSSWRHKPKELTRRLMKLIVGKDELRRMTATGKANTPMIPSSVFKAVFLYVNKKTPENVTKLTEKLYRRVLTNMCNTLRNPKKPSTTQNSRARE